MHASNPVVGDDAAWKRLAGWAALAWSKTSAAGIFVWTIWAVLLLLALGYVWTYGRNCPYWDEWETLPALTGEYSLFTWLWCQENEHRAPLPKFVYYVLTRLSGYDFRATMYASVVAQGVLAAALALANRRLRGQHHFADAFFPILLLNWGHGEIFLMGYNFPFALTALLTGALLILLLQNRQTIALWFALATGSAILLLALSAAHGLIMALGLSAWAGFLCLRQWRRSAAAEKGARLLLLAFLSAVVLWAAYALITYRQPGYIPSDHRPSAVLRTGLQFLTTGLGPAGVGAWRMLAVGIGILFFTTVPLLLWISLRDPRERGRAVGLLCVLGAVLAVSLAIGIGRAGQGPIGGLATRYTVLPAVGYCGLFFGWQLYGGRAFGRFLPMVLVGATTALLALNMQIAQGQGIIQSTNRRAFEKDLHAGEQPAVLARRHAKNIYVHEQAIVRGVILLDRAGARHFRMPTHADGCP